MSETVHTPTPGAVTACLAIDDLVAMADGSLDTARSEAVVGHVDRCSACAEVVAKLGSLDGPLRRVGRYQIDVLLGTGGMGIVYAAYDPELQRRIAIKLVRPDTSNDKYQAMILKEARTLARVSHPNIVAVYDVGVHEGEVYVATELVEGVTLAAWQPHRTATAIVEAWIQVARGLAAAHAQGVVHRDVKPANVFVGRDGRVRIGDFGIAHRNVTAADALDDTVHNTFATDPVAGTPAYMAPEQKTGRVDARSDQFSTCVAIVEALSGHRPEADEVVNVEPPALAATLTRGLRANPEERFPTMNGLANALERAVLPAPRPMRMYALFAVAALVIISATTAAVIEMRASGTKCQPPSVPAALWSPERRAALAKVLPGDISTQVDFYLAGWSKVASDVCTVSREPSIRRERTRCLERAIAQLDKVLTKWQASPPARIFDLYAAFETLPATAWCSNAAVTAAGVPPAEHAAAITEIQNELERDPGTIREGTQLQIRALATGYAPLIRWVAITRAGAQNDAQALQTLQLAVSEGPNDFTKARATVLMLSHYDATQVAEAEARAKDARAQIAALGGDPVMEAELDYRLVGIYASAQRADDGIAAAERMHQSMRAAYGAGSAQEASSLVTLAGAYYKRDGTRSDRGREAALAADAIWAKLGIEMPSTVIPATATDLIKVGQKFVDMMTKQHGAGSKELFDAEYALVYAYQFNGESEKSLEHAQIALALAKKYGIKTSRIGDINKQVVDALIDLGRPREAVAFANAAIENARSLKLEEDIALDSEALGRALVESGDLEAARAPLELALKHFTRTNVKPGVRGRARFLLAMVRFRKESAKAIDEAKVARVEIESLLASDDLNPALDPIAAAYLRPRYERWLAKLDAWLKSPK